jgi:hypothetical protein
MLSILRAESKIWIGKSNSKHKKSKGAGAPNKEDGISAKAKFT